MTANAATLGPTLSSSLVDMPEEDFARVMSVNFGGTLLCFKYAIPAILRAGGGAMTATSALAAHVGYAGMSAYTSSKGAIVALVRCLAAELGETIRVNTVSGGGGTMSQLGTRNRRDIRPGRVGIIRKIGPGQRSQGGCVRSPVPGVGRVVVHQRAGHCRRPRRDESRSRLAAARRGDPLTPVTKVVAAHRCSGLRRSRSW